MAAAAASHHRPRRGAGGCTITTGSGAGPAASRSTIATASARLDAPSFASTFPTCQFTVLSAMDRVAAIAFVVSPAATS